MGVNTDRGRRAVTYLRAYSGEPLFTFDRTTKRISGPMGIDLIVDTSTSKRAPFARMPWVKDLPGLPGILYAGQISDTDEMVAILPIKTLAELVRLARKGETG